MLKILSFLALFFIVFLAYSQSISGTFSQLPKQAIRLEAFDDEYIDLGWNPDLLCYVKNSSALCGSKPFLPIGYEQAAPLELK